MFISFCVGDFVSGCPSGSLASWLADRCGTVVVHDEPRAPLAAQIGPDPLQEDAQSKARCGQELDMNECPNQPRPQPADLYFAALQYGKTLAHHGHGTLVEVAKRTWRPAAR